MSDEQSSRKSRIPNPPRLCIFCGGTPISKEHVYADWMRKHLPFFSETTHRVKRSFLNEAGELEHKIFSGQLNLKGDHRAKGLKVVCQKCNGGWMSLLQIKARPTLEPLIEGKWLSLHNRDQQKSLAIWVVMFTMVFVQADLETSAVSKHQLSEFKIKQKPPQRWAVWIAPYIGSRYQAGARHRGRSYIVNGSHQKDNVSGKCNTQFTAGAAGHFFFLAFHSADAIVFDLIYRHIRNTAKVFGLHRVWPTAVFNQRLGAIDDAIFEAIIPLMSDICKDPYKESRGPQFWDI